MRVHVRTSESPCVHLQVRTCLHTRRPCRRLDSTHPMWMSVRCAQRCVNTYVCAGVSVSPKCVPVVLALGPVASSFGPVT